MYCIRVQQLQNQVSSLTSENCQGTGATAAAQVHIHCITHNTDKDVLLWGDPLMPALSCSLL